MHNLARMATPLREDADADTDITCARCGGNALPWDRDNGRQHSSGGCAGCGGTGRMTPEQRARWARKVDGEVQSGVRRRL